MDQKKFLKSWHLLLQRISILCSSLKCFDTKFYLQPREWVECIEYSFPSLNFMAIELLSKLSVHVFLYIIYVYMSQQQQQKVLAVKKPKNC